MQAQDILSDGVNEIDLGGTIIRKGSVGAFLANAATLRNPAMAEPAREAALRDIQAMLPALQAWGLFEALEIRSPQLRAFVEARL